MSSVFNAIIWQMQTSPSILIKLILWVLMLVNFVWGWMSDERGSSSRSKVQKNVPCQISFFDFLSISHIWTSTISTFESLFSYLSFWMEILSSPNQNKGCLPRWWPAAWMLMFDTPAAGIYKFVMECLVPYLSLYEPAGWWRLSPAEELSHSHLHFWFCRVQSMRRRPCREVTPGLVCVGVFVCYDPFRLLSFPRRR